MSHEIAFQVLIRVSVLSLAAWLVGLVLTRRSGSLRAGVAGCGLAACVLVPMFMPLLRTPAPAPIALPAQQEQRRVMQTSSPGVSAPPKAQVAAVTAEPVAGATIPWERASLILAAFVSGLLLLRIGFGAMEAARLARRGRSTTILGRSVRITDERVSPMTVMARTVVVPAAMAEWPEDQVRPILEHEMAHARRLDAVTMFLSSVVCAVFCAVPFVWLVRRQLIRAIEDAADDQVLALDIDPLTYAETLRRACKAFRSAPAQVPTFARKSMISARIERTLKPAVDRRRLGLVGGGMLAAVAALTAGASAYGLLEVEPLKAQENSKEGSAQVEIVQLQTMDAKPVFWKTDGTRIPALKAITTAHSLKPNPGDVVVWARVRDPLRNAHLWIVNAGGFNTNGGYGFWKDGWWYSASRIYSGGKSLPAIATLRAQAAVGAYRSLGDYLTASMIEKGEGKNAPATVGKEVVVQWGNGPFAWDKWDGRKPAGRQSPTESFFADVKVNRDLDEGSIGFRCELKDSKQVYQTAFQGLNTPSDDEMKFRCWIQAKPQDIKRMWLETRPNHRPEFKGVALRPKG